MTTNTKTYIIYFLAIFLPPIIIITTILILNNRINTPEPPPKPIKFTSISPYTHKNHNYLYFTRTQLSGGNGGIVHDPDCPCHTKE